jgi:hypothetical protein
MNDGRLIEREKREEDEGDLSLRPQLLAENTDLTSPTHTSPPNSNITTTLE